MDMCAEYCSSEVGVVAECEIDFASDWNRPGLGDCTCISNETCCSCAFQ